MKVTGFSSRRANFSLARLFRLVSLGLGLATAASSLAAESVEFKIQDSLPVKERQLPYSLYVSLSEISETRLGVDTFLDLRTVQKLAPALLSNVLEETCKQKFALAVSDVQAEQNAVILRGQFQAKFYACNTKDPKVHYRGVLLFGQNVDVQVRTAADVSRNCVRFRLVDLDLDPQGFVGSVSDWIGLTEKAETLIVEKSAEVLANNPVCPTLPEELASLDPRFTSGGTREIGDGGVGASLTGSVDTSAATLLDLLRLLQEKGDAEGGE